MVIQLPTAANRPQGVSESTERCMILHERARRYFWQGTGQLSIKCFFAGRAHYSLGRGRFMADASSYLILSEAQHYQIEIESRQPVESFCLFFAPKLAREVQLNLTLKAQQLLDRSGSSDQESVRFYERTYAHDQLLSPKLLQLRETYLNRSDGSLMEEIYGILESLLRVHEIVRGETAKLGSLRPATRDELYRRVWRARDYARAMFAGPVSLSELARVACLSPNHLLRTFREAFNETPHQFLTECRLQESRRLLRFDDLPVTEICLAVGFESLGSFSALFRKRFGFSPSECRRMKR
jgi:AraC family transcriptional regulator